MHKIKRIAFSIFFLFLNLFTVTSCNNDNDDLKKDDNYKIMWAYFEKKNITPMFCRDYVLFEENQWVNVIRRSDDYRTIAEIRKYPSVVPTKKTFETYVHGMTVFEIVEHFGMPEEVYSTTPYFAFSCKDTYGFAVAFFCDDQHLYYAL